MPKIGISPKNPTPTPKRIGWNLTKISIYGEKGKQEVYSNGLVSVWKRENPPKYAPGEVEADRWVFKHPWEVVHNSTGYMLHLKFRKAKFV
jgi:hypothetical protein